MLEDNLTHISTKNSIQHELSVVVDRFHSSYSTCDTQRLHQCLHAIDATRPVGIKKMFGGDKDSKHIISRILTCRYIVEALHRTRLGLAPSHTPSHDHDERFYADGSQYHIWWKQPSQLIYVLYFLQSLNLGPVSTLNPDSCYLSYLEPAGCGNHLLQC
jgi:hypothetical protein